MDTNELMNLLNLKPKEGVQDEQRRSSAALSIPGIPSGRSDSGGTGEISTHALHLDAYDKEMGSKLLRFNHSLRATGLDPEPISDFHGSLFLTSPQRVEKCLDPRRLEFVTQTMESPDYNALHRSTELNPVASELACVELAKSFAKLKEEDKKREDKNKQDRANGKKVNQARDDLKKSMACMKAVGAGLKQAEKEVEDYEEAMTALGCGDGQGNNNQLDIGKTVDLYQKIKDSKTLRSIIDKAGRCRRFAQAQQRKKVKHGVDDLVDIVLDGELARILPHELAQLALPEFEMDATRRLVERMMLCKQYRGVEKVGKGPIIVTVDESGSMSGNPVEWAKGIALTMAWIARHQKRWCCLIGYSGGTEGNKLILPPHKWDESKLVDWLVHFYSGGTSLDVCVDTLPTVYWPELLASGMKRGQVDLIVITDALVHLPREMEQNFLKWKTEEKVKTYSIILGQPAGDMKKISDEIYTIPHLDLGQEAVQRILSI